MLDGHLGGALRPDRAGRHDFQAAEPRNERSIDTLLQRGVRAVHLGRGGAVRRESVIKAFARVKPTTRDAAGGR